MASEHSKTNSLKSDKTYPATVKQHFFFISRRQDKSGKRSSVSVCQEMDGEEIGEGERAFLFVLFDSGFLVLDCDAVSGKSGELEPLSLAATGFYMSTEDWNRR